MNQSLGSWFCISCLFLLFSCNKNIKDDFPEENNCEKYAGNYDMFDPDENIHYTMKIRCSSGVIFGATKWDSLKFENFANKFELNYGIGENSFAGTLVNPLSDKEGSRWNFGNVYYPDTLNRINVLLGDSIYIYMNFDNTAYWMEDEVSYHSIETVHRGRKIH